MGLLEQKDLTEITDPLWKRFYQKEFGEDHTNLVIKRIKAAKGKVPTWRELFEVRPCSFFICRHFWLPRKT
jgi:elongin-A